MRIQKIFFIILAFFFAAPSFSQEWKQKIDSANAYKVKRDMTEAVRCFLEAKEALQKDSLYTDTYLQTGKSAADLYYINLGQGDEAITLYEELRAISVKMNRTGTKIYSDICNNLGTIYNIYGLLDTALALHLQAKDIRKQLMGESDRDYAQSCNNLGALYRDFGYYDLAEPLLLKAKEIREKVAPAGKFPAYAITCTALANLYRDLGQYDLAESLYITAKKVREDTLTKAHPLYAYSCNILADLYAYRGLFEKAESLYLEAKELRMKPGNEEAYAETCNNLGALYRDQGRFDRAEPLLLEAKNLYEEKFPGGRPSGPINYNNLGELYYAMGNYAAADSFYLKARTIWEMKLGKEHPYYITNSDEMVRLYRNTNEPQKADSLIREIARLKYKQLNRVFQFMSEAEKNQYLQNINGSADEYLSFYFTDFPRTKAGEPYDISLSNRNLVLRSIQQTRQAVYTAGDPALAAVYTEWVAIRQQLARLFSRGAQADTMKLRRLEAGADKLEKELSRGSAAFQSIQNNPGWRDIQQHLEMDETAIEFAEFRVHNKRSWSDSIFYAALVIRKGFSEPVLVPLFEKQQLDLLLGKRNARSEQGINLGYTSPELYRLIWKPIEKHLTGITKIYFAPAGLLHQVSMAALNISKNQVVGDKYQLVQLLTTASVTDSRETQLSVSDKVLLYGDVQYDADSSAMMQAAMKYSNGSLVSRSVDEDLIGTNVELLFKPLQFSGAEVDSIANLASAKEFSAISFKGASANEESIKALNEEQGPFVLHISTHGFFNKAPQKNKPTNSKDLFNSVFVRSENPLFRGGLILAGADNTRRGNPVAGLEDGVLTGYEVSNLFFPHNKLVVLSACETALGDLGGSEGVYGLQRAFKMAGTQHLMMSLWKVPDDITAVFMKVFYKNLFNGLSINEAFYRAQQELKDKYRNEPYKWAAWVLVR